MDAVPVAVFAMKKKLPSKEKPSIRETIKKIEQTDVAPIGDTTEAGRANYALKPPSEFMEEPQERGRLAQMGIDTARTVGDLARGAAIGTIQDSLAMGIRPDPRMFTERLRSDIMNYGYGRASEMASDLANRGLEKLGVSGLLRANLSFGPGEEEMGGGVIMQPTTPFPEQEEEWQRRARLLKMTPNTKR